MLATTTNKLSSVNEQQMGQKSLLNHLSILTLRPAQACSTVFPPQQSPRQSAEPACES